MRDHNGKVKWINNIEKELDRLEERLKAKIRLDSLRATFKKYQIGKRQFILV